MSVYLNLIHDLKKHKNNNEKAIFYIVFGYNGCL